MSNTGTCASDAAATNFPSGLNAIVVRCPRPTCAFQDSFGSPSLSVQSRRKVSRPSAASPSPAGLNASARTEVVVIGSSARGFRSAMSAIVTFPPSSAHAIMLPSGETATCFAPALASSVEVGFAGSGFSGSKFV